MIHIYIYFLTYVYDYMGIIRNPEPHQKINSSSGQGDSLKLFSQMGNMECRNCFPFGKHFRWETFPFGKHDHFRLCSRLGNSVSQMGNSLVSQMGNFWSFFDLFSNDFAHWGNHLRMLKLSASYSS